jgi:uncharacterized membrane protein
MAYENSNTTGRLARGLGVASAGLGLAALIAPGRLSRACGVHHPVAARVILPVLGARELGHAAGLVPGRQPSRWIWTRVAGDAMDLSLLGSALADRRNDRRRVAMATAAVATMTALDVFAAIGTARARGARRRGPLQMGASVTVNRATDEVYEFWQDLENLPTFMHHLESVEVTGPRSSHWTASAPGGRSVEWDAEVVEDRPAQRISWRSVPGARVENSGTVRFVPAPGGRGTEVRVELNFSPPGGRVGAAVAKLFGEHPYQQVRDDLRRFKQVIETGEVTRSEGSPEGLNARRQVRQRSSQPLPAFQRPIEDRRPAPAERGQR